MASINDRLRLLEEEIKYLKDKLGYTDTNQTPSYQPPTSTAGMSRLAARNRPVDTKSGYGAVYGGPVVWNDSELATPPINEEPDEPNKGYNKHTHTEFSGGALLADEVEVIQYDWSKSSVSNKHSQGYWQSIPPIKTAVTSGKFPHSVQMKGKVNFIFDPDTQTWGVAAYEIDVEACNLVQYERDENTGVIIGIKRDSKNQEMKSPLYNEDVTKSSVIWDENAACWRLMAVYAPEPEETP